MKPSGSPEGRRRADLRRLAQAVLLISLVGCSSLDAIAQPGSLPPKPTRGAATAPVPTPFAPSIPTPAPADEDAPTPDVGAWPPPNTYGRAPTPSVEIPPPAEVFTFPEGSLNVLLLGSDRRTGIGFRTDTIVIASIQPTTGLVALVSVPRDLYVYLPGFTVSRINTAWIYGETLGYPGGGPQLLFDTVRYNLGVPVDRYALVEMAGFQQIVDLLGGVDVRVACDFTDWRLRRPDLPQEAVGSWALFTVPRGVVHMDGDFALWYARSRSRSSDFDRARRQQEVLRALYRGSLQPGVLSRIPELYRALQSSVKSDADLDDVLALAPFATRLEPAHLRSRFIGRPQVQTFRVPASGAAVLLPKPDEIHALLTEAFAPYEESQVVPVRVEVVPGTDRQVAELVQERLLYAGFNAVVVDGDPSPDGGSHVLEPPGTEPHVRAALLAALGLSDVVVTARGEADSRASFRLLVGDNYNPCVDPATLVASG
jgi:LCP family protein required for cell wall assembly